MSGGNKDSKFGFRFTQRSSFIRPRRRSPLYTLFLPFRVPPYTDGRSWARRQGYTQHHGVQQGEELTDDEDGEDD
jgi:hypothetical protein